MRIARPYTSVATGKVHHSFGLDAVKALLPEASWGKPEPVIEPLGVSIASWAEALPPNCRFGVYVSERKLPTAPLLALKIVHGILEIGRS